MFLHKELCSRQCFFKHRKRTSLHPQRTPPDTNMPNRNYGSSLLRKKLLTKRQLEKVKGIDKLPQWKVYLHLQKLRLISNVELLNCFFKMISLYFQAIVKYLKENDSLRIYDGGKHSRRLLFRCIFVTHRGNSHKRKFITDGAVKWNRTNKRLYVQD